jgi:prepilin peptidase CpaA
MFETLHLLCLAIAACALIAAAVHDIRSYEIPDRFATLIAFAFVVGSLTGGLHTALSGILLGTIVFAVGLGLFALRCVGGGDVKLLAATSLWVTAPLVANFALVTSLAGAALGLVLMTPLRRLFPAPPAELVAVTGTAGSLRQPMPFGVAIAIGGLFVLAVRMTV